MVSTKYSAVYLVNSRSMTSFLSCQANYRKEEVILLDNTAMGDWIKIINMAFNTCYSI